MIEINKIYNEDCLVGMQKIPDKSVDMILCDLPYGIGSTACKWDVQIPLDDLWHHYKRICKANTPIVLTTNQPFTSMLVMSNLEMFKYEWIWEKDGAGNFVLAKFCPLKYHETILVFYDKPPVYNPIMWDAGKPTNKPGKKPASLATGVDTKVVLHSRDSNTRYPKSIIKFNREKHNNGLVHPTQKPVSLFEYLIKTYTNERMMVLDNCIGSGTTAIACINTNRNYIGFEKDEKYFQIATDRINKRLEEVKNVELG